MHTNIHRWIVSSALTFVSRLTSIAAALVVLLMLSYTPAMADDNKAIPTMTIDGKVYTMVEIEANEDIWDIMTEEQWEIFVNWQTAEIEESEKNIAESKKNIAKYQAMTKKLRKQYKQGEITLKQLNKEIEYYDKKIAELKNK